MTDDSLLEWASGWLRANSDEDPTFRQRFKDALRWELEERRIVERAEIVAWLWSEDARRYTEVGPLIGKALEEKRDRYEDGSPIVRVESKVGA
jgi:hypothetical protein